MRRLKVVMILSLVVLTSNSYSWMGANHKQFVDLAKGLIERDCEGEDYERVVEILDEYDETIKFAVIAPDVIPLKLDPISTSDRHGWHPFLHCGFAGQYTTGAYHIGKEYGEKAEVNWTNGNPKGSLFDLFNLEHLVQDASFSGHSNTMNPLNMRMHHGFEEWVKERTEGKSFEELKEECWATDFGGIYFYDHFFDEKGTEHWPGDLAGWIDVAAHYSYPCFEFCLPEIKETDPHLYEKNAKYQFLLAQRVTAGLIVDFFKRVGVIKEPPLYFPRKKRGKIEVWKLEDGQIERVTGENKDFWPTRSPDGYWKVGCGSHPMGSYYNLELVNWYSYTSGRTYLVNNINPRPEDKRPLLFPSKIALAFFFENQTIGLVHQNQGDSWHRIYLVPRDWGPNVRCPIEGGESCYNNMDKGELGSYRVKRISLPDTP